jgi:hypothetical protein
MTKRVREARDLLRRVLLRLGLSSMIAVLAAGTASAQVKGLQIEEATIADIQSAIADAAVHQTRERGRLSQPPLMVKFSSDLDFDGFRFGLLNLPQVDQ